MFIFLHWNCLLKTNANMNNFINYINYFSCLIVHCVSFHLVYAYRLHSLDISVCVIWDGQALIVQKTSMNVLATLVRTVGAAQMELMVTPVNAQILGLDLNVRFPGRVR